MKALLTLIAAVLALFVLAYGIGMLVPLHHVAARSARYAEAPEKVWALLADVSGYARWAPEVTGVRRMPDRDGHAVYQLEGKWAMPLEIDESVAPRRMVTRIADPKLPFGGTWTWELRREGRGTRVTVAERGEIKPPPIRALARFVFGYTSTMDQYLEALGRGLHETVKPEPAEAGA